MKTNQLIVFIFLSISWAYTIQAQDFSGENFTKDRVSWVLFDMSERLGMMARLSSEAVSIPAWELRNQAQITKQNLENLAVVLDETQFTALTNEQINAVTIAANTLGNREEGLESNARDIEALGKNLDDAFGKFYFTIGTPRIFGFGPAFVVQDKIDSKGHKIKIYGRDLDNGRPHLSIRLEVCDLVNQAPTELEFYCRIDSLLGQNLSYQMTSSNQLPETRTFMGNLTVYQKNEKLFGITSELVPQRYDLPITIVPEILGRYILEVRTVETTRETRERSRSLSHRNSYCERRTRKNWTVTSSLTEGWLIDTSSVKTSFNGSPQSRLLTVKPSPEKIFLEAEVINMGVCAKIFLGTQIRDVPGSITLTVNWKEIRAQDVVATEILGDGNIYWRTPVNLELPSEAAKFVLKIDQSDGSDQYITQYGDYSWISVKKGEGVKNLIITPKDPSNALSLQ